MALITAPLGNQPQRAVRDPVVRRHVRRVRPVRLSAGQLSPHGHRAEHVVRGDHHDDEGHRQRYAQAGRDLVSLAAPSTVATISGGISPAV